MSKHPQIRLGVLVSGAGRTLQNFIDLIAAGRLDAEVAVVISSRDGARGLELARSAGIPALVVEPRGAVAVADAPHCEGPAAGASFHARIADALREARVDLVCMAGFLNLWRIPADFERRVMNVHPALLPAFGGPGMYGQRVHEAVLAAGCRVSGCTVHFADHQYDHGPIILQRTVSVLPDDTVDTLAQRVFAEELMAYPEAVRLFAAGRLRIDGSGRVTIVPVDA